MVGALIGSLRSFPDLTTAFGLVDYGAFPLRKTILESKTCI